MIKNERQYRISKVQARRFKETLGDLRRRDPGDRHQLLVQAEIDAVQSQLEELETDLAEYAELKAGRREVPEIDWLSDLPEILIRARIANGLSQKELAERLGLKEQQIQRYEATDYSTTSLNRIIEIAKALGASPRRTAD